MKNADLRKIVFTLLEEEFDRTRRMLLRISGHRELLERNPVLARAIRLRNPYVDVLSLIQVELHQRYRRWLTQYRLPWLGFDARFVFGLCAPPYTVWAVHTVNADRNSPA